MKLAAAMAALLSAIAIAYAQAHGSTRDGVYTDAQASRGEVTYKKACASCHAESLEGSGAATPPLAGADFEANWNGQSLDDLFERIQTSMPADHPGTLSRTENAAVLAYILKVNKFPAGKTDLPRDADLLKQIQFEAVK